MNHADIQHCNKCFIAHQRVLKIYEKEIEKWDEMIEHKRNIYGSWDSLVTNKQNELKEITKIAETRIEELRKILKDDNIKKLLP